MTDKDEIEQTPAGERTESTAVPMTPAVPMTEDGIPMEANGRKLSPVEIQALREARARRAAIDRAAALPPEKGGSSKPGEPTRYGDWERDGRAYDFS